MTCTTTDGVGHAVSPAVRRKTDVDQNLGTSLSQQREVVNIPQSNPANDVQAMFQNGEVDGKTHAAVFVPRLTDETFNQSSRSNTIFDSSQMPDRGSRHSATVTDESPHSVLSPSMSGLRTLSHEGGGMAVNTDDSSFRRQYMGPSSLQVMTQWLQVTLSAYGATESFSSRFRHGMRHAVEIELPLAITDIRLPTKIELDDLLRIYFNSTNSIFPLLNETDFRAQVAHLPRVLNFHSLIQAQRPSTACLLAVLSIASDEKSGGVTADGTRYLEAAYSLYASLVSMPYLMSVQALLLITVALMGRNKEGAGFYALGQGIRIAQSLGLHRNHQSEQMSDSPQGNQATTVWWCAYCLERLMIFETGRPGMILDIDIDLAMPLAKSDGVQTLEALVGLARLQGEISTRLYGGAEAAHDASTVFNAIAEIDSRLQAWMRSMPEEIRPGSDTLWCSPKLFPFAMYLAFQYHQTIITLHRPALLLDNNLYREQLDAVCATNPAYHRLIAGESFCVSSARLTATLLNNAVQQNRKNRLPTLTQPLLAVYVLAIHIIKHPWSWSAISDLKLMATTSTLVENSYQASGQAPAFYSMLQDLRALAEQSIQLASSKPSNGTTMSVDPGHSLVQNNTETTQRQTEIEDSNSALITDLGGANEAALAAQGNLQLFDNWPLLFGDEFDPLSLTEDASTLLGLPFVGDVFDLSGNADI